VLKSDRNGVQPVRRTYLTLRLTVFLRKSYR